MELPVEIQALVNEHSALTAINRFLYSGDDVLRAAFKSVYKGTRNDVFARQYEIRHKDMLPFALSMNGLKVIATDSSGKKSEGVIEFNQFREYEGRRCEDGVWTSYIFEGRVCTYKETIGFWVNTGDKYTSHMYTVDQIELID
jgi:hypothetical protein